tara:strand:- start:27551 stop:27745 length:195 start_codon:yes stop_codon:yes gene_type:complete
MDSPEKYQVSLNWPQQKKTAATPRTWRHSLPIKMSGVKGLGMGKNCTPRAWQGFSVFIFMVFNR